jgi:hypothetical protein
MGELLRVVGLVVALALPPGGTFVDDDGSPHEADIEAIAAEGITRGCDVDRFCPEDSVTRGQMAAFLVRALGLEATGTGGFTDTAGSVFAADIDRLAAAGITRGCGTTRYCPDDPVTRGQMAAFLRRALGDRITPGPPVEFVDDDASVFEGDIEWLGATGITRGCNPPANDRFCPDRPSPASRWRPSSPGGSISSPSFRHPAGCRKRATPTGTRRSRPRRRRRTCPTPIR